MYNSSFCEERDQKFNLRIEESSRKMEDVSKDAKAERIKNRSSFEELASQFKELLSHYEGDLHGMELVFLFLEDRGWSFREFQDEFQKREDIYSKILYEDN